MGVTSWRRLGLVACLLAAPTGAIFGVLRDRGFTLPSVPWVIGPILAALAVVVVVLGWPIGRYTRHLKAARQYWAGSSDGRAGSAGSWTGGGGQLGRRRRRGGDGGGVGGGSRPDGARRPGRIGGDQPALPRLQPVDPLRAARVLALARACSLAGAALTGVYGAQVLTALVDLGTPAGRERAWLAGAASAGAIMVMLAGLLVERMCKLPPAAPDPADPTWTADPA